MPRGNSRKYKRYRQVNPKQPKDDNPNQKRPSERLSYFGEMQPRREDGIVDLTPYNAALGQELIASAQYDNGRSIVKRRGRPPKLGALNQ